MFQRLENSGVISLASMARIAAVKVSGGFFNVAIVLHIHSCKKNPAEAGFFKFISYEIIYGEQETPKLPTQLRLLR